MTRHLDWKLGLLAIVESINLIITAKGSCVLLVIISRIPIIALNVEFPQTNVSNNLQIGPNVSDSHQKNSLTTRFILFLASAQIVIRSARTGRGREKSTNNHCRDVKVMAGEATSNACVETAMVWSCCSTSSAESFWNTHVSCVLICQHQWSPSFWSFMVYKNYEIDKLKYITNDTGFLIRERNRL